MRSREVLKNTIVSLISYFSIVVIGFLSQGVFIKTLGSEYLGLHSLFSNIVTMLAIVELGFGSAVISNLYKPVAEKNYVLINGLLEFYKKIYRYIAIIVSLIGLIITPFIDKIVGESSLEINYKVIFLFYLIDTVASYLLSYKRSILYAYQKAYIINIIHTIMILLMNVLQVIVLIYTKNYYLYLILRIACRILENLFINWYVNNRYTFIHKKKSESLPIDVKRDILKKVKGLLFHKIGTFIVCGTDNIIISILPGLGIKCVGLYSNYLLITNQLSNVIGQVFNSLTASIGNLLVECNYDKSYKVFKSVMLVNAWIYTYVSISLYYVSKPFISLWIGSEYIFKDYIVLALVINFYISGMRKPYTLFKEAAGIFYEDRFVPIIESIVNLIISLIAGYFFGIVGVFIGTICSNFILFLYSYPKYVYKKIFNRKVTGYLIELAYYIVLFSVNFFTCAIIISIVNINNQVLDLIWKVSITFILCNSIFYLISRKTLEFKYFLNKMIKKRTNS